MKKGLKSTFIILLALVFVFGLSACSEKKDIYDIGEDEANDIIEEIYGYEEDYASQYVVEDGKIDLSEIIGSVKFENFNGYGYLQVSHLACALSDIIDDETMKNFVATVAPELAAIRYSKGYEYYFEEIINFEPIEDYRRLSNGDVVTLVAKVTEEFERYGVTVASVKEYFDIDFDETATYTVSGLLEGGTPIDILSYVKQYVVYDEANGGYKMQIPTDFSVDINGFNFKQTFGDTLNVAYMNEYIGTVDFDAELERGKIKISMDGGARFALIEKGYFFADMYTY